LPIIQKLGKFRKTRDMKVSSAEFQKQSDTLADKALTEPVTITRNGRNRLVLLSVEEYERLKRRYRRVVRLEDFTDEEMALIATAEVPTEYAHLDDELKDWQA
jgi:prevent-host-death family protein